MNPIVATGSRLSVRQVRRVLASVLLSVPAIVIGQTPTASLRVLVRDTLGVAIQGATVSLRTGARELTSAVTDSSGLVAFTVDADRALRISVGRQGFVSVARDIVANERLLRAGEAMHFVLRTNASQALAAARITASAVRQTTRADRRSTATGALSESLGALSITVMDLGDIGSMVASAPGADVERASDGTTGMFSVLGLRAEQSVVLMNGMRYPSWRYPRALPVVPRLYTSSMDPALGWFSSGIVSLDVPAGNSFRSGRLFVSGTPTAATPAPTAFARAAEIRTNSLRLSLATSGEERDGQVAYSIGGQYLRDGNYRPGLSSMLSGDTVTDADRQVRDLRQLLHDASAVGLPEEGRAAVAAPMEDVTLLGRVDLRSKGSGVLSFVGFGGESKLRGFGAPLSSRWSASTYNSSNVGVQAEWFGPIAQWNAKARIGWSGSNATRQPLLSLPRAEVAFPPDDTSASRLISVSLGGAGIAKSQVASEDLEVGLELTKAAGLSRHSPRLAVALRVESSRTELGATAGTYTFSSEQALRQGDASYFARDLSTHNRAARSWNAAIGIGDLWRISDQLTVQAGARVEFARLVPARFAGEPIPSVLLSGAGRPTYFSAVPRIGFEWSPSSVRRGANAPGRLSTLRGSIGAYRGLLPASVGTTVNASQEAAEESKFLWCAGATVPTPDWRSFVSGEGHAPSVCDDAASLIGSGGIQRSYQLLSKRFRVPVAYRANVGWVSRISSELQASADLVASVAEDQQSVRDRNVRDYVVGRLASPDGRPLFASPDAFDPMTGRVPLSASRVNSSLGYVNVLASDLRSFATQAVLRVSATGPYSVQHFAWTAAYAYTRVWDRLGGSGSGLLRPSSQPKWFTGSGEIRHSLSLSATLTLRSAESVSLVAQSRSGRRFSLFADGDLNGDGVASDLAYIPNLDGPGDATAEALRQATSRWPRWASDCVRQQAGRIATPNACVGPASHLVSVTANLNGTRLGLSERTRIFITASNVLSLLDELLHARGNVRGWGQAVRPAVPLLIVRGFDKAASTFKYQVNEAFGSRWPGNPFLAQPFRLAVELSIPLHPDRSRQLFNRLMRAQRLTSDSAFLASQVRLQLQATAQLDPAAAVLAARAALGLSADQARRIGEARTAYQRVLRVASDSLTTYLRGNDPSLDVAESWRSMRKIQDFVWDGLIAQAKVIHGLLTPLQRQQLPQSAAMLLDGERLTALRRFERQQ